MRRVVATFITRQVIEGVSGLHSSREWKWVNRLARWPALCMITAVQPLQIYLLSGVVHGSQGIHSIESSALCS